MTEKESFLDAIKNRVLLFDGAMGTEIQKFNPKPEDFPNNQDGFNDGLVVTHPEWIKQIHRNYLDAGSDCIETWLTLKAHIAPDTRLHNIPQLFLCVGFGTPGLGMGFGVGAGPVLELATSTGEVLSSRSTEKSSLWISE